MKGAPLCFIGRELWQWSRLYQEMLEGISEICGANGSPLISLSSRSLVRQDAPTLAPRFASTAAQSRELSKLIPHVPKGCAGIVLDHMWAESALKKCSWPGAERIQLLRGTGLLHAHHIRLRVDCRRLGRAAPSYLFHGTPVGAFSHALVDPASAED